MEYASGSWVHLRFRRCAIPSPAPVAELILAWRAHALPAGHRVARACDSAETQAAPATRSDIPARSLLQKSAAHPWEPGCVTKFRWRVFAVAHQLGPCVHSTRSEA